MPTVELWTGAITPIPGRAVQGSCVTQAQFRSWLATVDVTSPPAVAGHIPYLTSDPVNIAWQGPYVMCGDALTRFAAARLGMTWTTFQGNWSQVAAFPVVPA